MSDIDPWKSSNEISADNLTIHNKRLFFGLVLFLLSIYLPLFSFDGTTVSISEDCTTLELLFVSGLLLFGAYAAYQGQYAVIAKVLGAIILAITAYQIIDIYREESSELKMILDLLNIDLSRSRGWSKLAKYIGIAAYLYLLSIIFLILAMMAKVNSKGNRADADSKGMSAELFDKEALNNNIKNASDFAHENAAKGKNWFLSEYNVLKQKWNGIEYVSAPLLADTVAEISTAIKQSEFKRAISALWCWVKPYLIRVCTWISVTFSANIPGKVIVIALGLLIYQLVF